MKKSRFTDSQILAILKQNEADMPVKALCREHGMFTENQHLSRAGTECSYQTQETI